MLFVHQRLNCFPLSSSQKMASTWGAVCLPGNSLCPRLAEGWKLEGAFCPGGKGVHASLSSAWRREVSSPKGPEASSGPPGEERSSLRGRASRLCHHAGSRPRGRAGPWFPPQPPFLHILLLLLLPLTQAALHFHKHVSFCPLETFLSTLNELQGEQPQALCWWG